MEANEGESRRSFEYSDDRKKLPSNHYQQRLVRMSGSLFRRDDQRNCQQKRMPLVGNSELNRESPTIGTIFFSDHALHLKIKPAEANKRLFKTVEDSAADNRFVRKKLNSRGSS